MRISDWSSDVCSSDLFPSHDNEGFIRYYNIKKYVKSDGKIIVANRRNAGLLLVEPKINAPFKGKVTVETLHEDTILIITNGTETKKYYLRKNDVAKPNELAGISGKVEGKLYLPYKDGIEVEQNESIVEMIKDGWNVPNRIPFASELKVEDAHFKKLSDQYDEVNHSIHRIESGVENHADEVLTELRKKRLHLKDELYALLSK